MPRPTGGLEQRAGADCEAGRRAGARDIAARRRPDLDVLLVPCLSAFLSKNLY
jgi:hypothetical protein